MVKIGIIGGGAAGMMAGIIGAEQGGDITIYERNPYLGKKLGITGKGRCNLTNNASIQEFMKNVPGNGPFLYSSLHQMAPTDVMAFFQNLGVELKIERGRRVFPVSDDAHTIVNALKNRLKALDVKVNYKMRITKLKIEDNQIKGLYAGEEYQAYDKLIIATGGASYPGTGSCGDGYALAGSAGHTIIEPRPSLVPLDTLESWVEELAGLALKNVYLYAKAGAKIIFKGFGEMLFTHTGISGPLVLTASYYVYPYLPQDEVKITIDLKPALKNQELEERILRDFKKFTRKQFQNSLNELLPASLIPVIISLSEIDPYKPVNQITKEERNKLAGLLKELPLTVRSTRGLSEAIITAGGVCVKEINPKTMESKLVKGLYFAGEVMDVDALTGGYNLQIAWSSGNAAAYHGVSDQDL